IEGVVKAEGVDRLVEERAHDGLGIAILGGAQAARRLPALTEAAQVIDEARVLLLGEGREQLLLRREVRVEGTAAKARARADVLHGALVDSRGDDEISAGGHEPILRV